MLTMSHFLLFLFLYPLRNSIIVDDKIKGNREKEKQNNTLLESHKLGKSGIRKQPIKKKKGKREKYKNRFINSNKNSNNNICIF